MLRHYLSLAFRHVARNRLYVLISVSGLAIGFGAATLIGLDLRRQTQVFSAFAGIAILIAVLGLVGLAAHAAVSRTKEIGIRKVVGGGRLEILRLLLWQFSRPVLLANVVAWPVTYYVMGTWLQGFARRVELDWWMFTGAAAVTLAVAVGAVSLHAWVMAGARPVEALRYQ